MSSVAHVTGNGVPTVPVAGPAGITFTAAVRPLGLSVIAKDPAYLNTCGQSATGIRGPLSYSPILSVISWLDDPNASNCAVPPTVIVWSAKAWKLVSSALK